MINRLIEKLYLKQKGNLAYYDNLTQVYNRMFYERELKKKYIGKECVVTFVDVNGLKIINDNKGHYEGDKLIIKVVEDLKKINYIDYIIRYGGDEFILISDKLKREELEKVKHISYGISMKAAYEDMSSAIAKADVLMYKQKENLKKGDSYYWQW